MTAITFVRHVYQEEWAYFRAHHAREILVSPSENGHPCASCQGDEVWERKRLLLTMRKLSWIQNCTPLRNVGAMIITCNGSPPKKKHAK